MAQHRERQRDEDDFASVYPLHRGACKADVEAFWRAQDFDLGLQWWGVQPPRCFLGRARSFLSAPSATRRARRVRWDRMETERRATFVKGRPLDVIHAAQTPTLRGVLDDGHRDAHRVRNCTDRRTPR